jgi:hypothetical protein
MFATRALTYVDRDDPNLHYQAILIRNLDKGLHAIKVGCMLAGRARGKMNLALSFATRVTRFWANFRLLGDCLLWAVTPKFFY